MSEANVPEAGKQAHALAIAWLRDWQLPCTATGDDGFPSALHRLRVALEEKETKETEIEFIIVKSTRARGIILRYEYALKCNWSPASCAELFMVFQNFKQLDLIMRGRQNLPLSGPPQGIADLERAILRMDLSQTERDARIDKLLAEKELSEADSKKKGSKGRKKKNISALHSWINGKTFSGFSEKVGVRKVAEKIAAEIAQQKPKGIEGTPASAIERVMKGATFAWSVERGFHSAKVSLSRLSQ